MRTLTKTLVISATAVALLAAGTPKAQADCGWATAGKVLTGVVAGTVLARALCPPPPTVVYAAPAPVVVQTVQPQPVVVQQVVAQPQVVVQPAPVVVYSAPAVVYAAPVVYSAPVYVRPCPRPVIGVGVYFGHPCRRW